MGKTQSKRSLDITTDPTKDGKIEEGSGKMGKIEDIDQLTPRKDELSQNQPESVGIEKATKEAGEQEKQSTTEKFSVLAPSSSNSTNIATEATQVTENANNDLLVQPEVTEPNAVSPQTETADNPQKTKKQKVKKKWSFRSISFSKKDKQKPPKTEESNAEIGKVLEETPQQEEVVLEASAPIENQAQTKESIKNPEAELNEVETKTNVEEKVENGPTTLDTEPVKQIATSDKEKESTLAQLETTITNIVSEAEHIDKTPIVIETVQIEVQQLHTELEQPIVVHTPTEVIENLESIVDPKIEEQEQEKITLVEEVAQPCTTIEESKTTKDVESASPPPLPSKPPPSQVTVFAESAMSTSDVTSLSNLLEHQTTNTEVNENEINITPIDTQTVVDELASIPITQEIACFETVITQTVPEQKVILDNNREDIISDSLIATNLEESNESIENCNSFSALETENQLQSNINENNKLPEPQPAEIISEIIESPKVETERDSQNNEESFSKQNEHQKTILSENAIVLESSNKETDEPQLIDNSETVSLIDKVTESIFNCDLNKTDDESLPVPPSDLSRIDDDESKDLSVDISSPLQQNSLDSITSPSLAQMDINLPSPPSETNLNSNIEIIATESDVILTPESLAHEKIKQKFDEKNDNQIEMNISNEEITNGKEIINGNVQQIYIENNKLNGEQQRNLIVTEKENIEF